jgi:hypothetical protein
MSKNFKRAAEMSRTKTGFHAPPMAKGSIPGTRAGRPYIVEYEVVLRGENFDKPTLEILNGSTGYESWYLESICPGVLNEPLSETFCICFGSDRYDELYVPVESIQNIVKPIWEKYSE